MDKIFQLVGMHAEKKKLQLLRSDRIKEKIVEL